MSSLDVQALPREVKEDWTERAILAINAMRAVLAKYGLLEENEEDKEGNTGKQLLCREAIVTLPILV